MARSTTQEILGRIKDAEKSSLTIGGGHRGVDITYSASTETSTSTHLRSGTHLHAGERYVTEDQLEDMRNVAQEKGFKEAMTRIWDMMPNEGDVRVLINTKDSIWLQEPDTRAHRIVVDRGYVLTKDEKKAEPTVVAEAIKELEVGWYQDDKANLYYYEGESHWKEVDLATNKKLTDDAILGKLEYIG